MLARKAEGTRISRPRMALNTLKGIHKEMSRVYRLSLAGTLPSGEMTRLIFGLREIRQTVEAQAEAAVIDMPVGSFSSELLVLSVPRGSLVDVRTGICTTPSGEPATMESFVPYQGTPALGELTDQTRSFEPLSPLPVIEEIADDKIAILHPHRRRDEPGTA
jgi:hypothetical protein